MISVTLIDVPSLLGRFHADDPDVSIRLRVSPGGSAGLAEAIQDGELGIAFLLLPAGSPPPGLSARELASVRLVAVVRADHPLADQESVPLARLAAEPFIDSPVGYGNRMAADQAFAASGVQRHVALETSDIAAGVQYIRHGFGIALLPDFIAPVEPDLRTLSVSDHPLRQTLSIATSAARQPSAAVSTFVGMVDQFVAAGSTAMRLEVLNGPDVRTHHCSASESRESSSAKT